jgi:Mrp family chromosome partitioning ATPase
MTALDKAFIKAYSQDVAHAPVPKPHFAMQQDGAKRRIAAIDAADAVVAQTKEAVHPLAVFADQDHEAESTQVTKIPLTQTAAVQPAAVQLAMVQPAFEVDQVVWPQVCRTLSSEIGDSLDAMVDQYMGADAGNSQTVGVIGTSQGAGCTTIALLLAQQLCQRDSVAGPAEVLLIDADLRNADLARSIGLAPQSCWNEINDAKAALGDALIESIADQLVVMPILRERPRAATEIDQQRLLADVTKLGTQYRKIVIDLGAFETADEDGLLSSLGGHIDTLLLVHDQHNGSEDQLDRIIDLAEQSQIEITGVIQNGAIESHRPTLVA